MIRPLRKEVRSTRPAPRVVVAPPADALLPWGDPYILKLAQDLEREARAQVEAALKELEAEAMAELDEDDSRPRDPDFGQPALAAVPRVARWPGAPSLTRGPIAGSGARRR